MIIAWILLVPLRRVLGDRWMDRREFYQPQGIPAWLDGFMVVLLYAIQFAAL